MCKITKFMELCLSGDVDVEDVDDFVDSWHDSESEEEIFDYLGMAEDEYALYVERPSSLPYIITSHRFGISIEEALEFEGGFALAARAKNAGEAHKVLEWLKKTGRV